MIAHKDIRGIRPVIDGKEHSDLYTIIWRNFMQETKNAQKASYLADEYIKQICPDAPMPYFSCNVSEGK